MTEGEEHDESCPLHWLPKGHAGAKCWCNTRTPTATPSDEVVRLREALGLARNRLQAAAINEAPKQSREYYDYSHWADEASAALSAIEGEKK